MTLEDILSQLTVGSIIDFKEYVLNRHERKVLNVSIEGARVDNIIQANTELDRDQLEQYYGTSLSDIDYLQLSKMNCPRIVVSLGLNQQNELNIKILVLNNDFIKLGLQTIDIIGMASSEGTPNYTHAMSQW